MSNYTLKSQAELPSLKGYVSIREAAEMLGLARKTVYEYVTEGRIPGVKAGDIILVRVEDVENFKPNISGRPRTTIPQWRISPADNTLFQTRIFVHIKPGKLSEFRQRLDEIRRQKAHLFPGTIARYIAGSQKDPQQVEISLIWRSSVAPDEAVRQQALEEFKQRLADVLDWENASYDEGSIFMHA
ncbi:DNA-binding protein [Ktedonosporobacter rubrisoli]|uniref:DNA-binding protein n=1 Tax=Ktedonosporobacter rubrisoli TaxID=2509675 RepID=A0A4P6JZ49_KTERU|nr:helix-turn-helix domain-containing protein [Ktedonosporobacter rubrisoli]QBD80763.1 DNA-binding protein [Ktedonosporobacter rubrisoli]